MAYQFNVFTGTFDIVGDSSVTGLVNGGVLFGSPTGGLAQDATNFFWDNTNDKLGIGIAAPTGQVHIASQSAVADRGLVIAQHNNAVSGGLAVFRRSRGTLSSPLTVANADLLGVFSSNPYDGTQYRIDIGLFGFAVTGTVSTGVIPTSIFLNPGSASGTYTPSLLAHHSRFIGIGNFGTVITSITAPSAHLHIKSEANGDIQVIVEGTAGQTAALQQWKKSTTVVASITADGVPTYDRTDTPAATTGNQTINKPSGTVNFAAAAVSLTVTNSLVTANSYVLVGVKTSDASMKFVQATPGAGSFVITPDAPPAAETRVWFIVVN